MKFSIACWRRSGRAGKPDRSLMKLKMVGTSLADMPIQSVAPATKS